MKRECAAPGKFLIASANVDVNKSFESFTMDVVKNSTILMMSWQKRYFGTVMTKVCVEFSSIHSCGER